MNNITLHVVYAKTLKEKTVGLIGTRKPQAMLFKTRFGIHTFGVRFPIDVLILDNNNIVVSLKQSLQRNRLLFWNPWFDTVVELPQETIKEKNIKKGDQIKIFVI